MKRNRRNNRDRIDRMELRRDITRFLSEDQYFVTLKILKSLSALKTESPAFALGLKSDNKFCLRMKQVQYFKA